MISAATIAGLEERGLVYILGVRERSSKEVYEVAQNYPASSIPFVIARPRGPDTELEAKRSASASAVALSAATSPKPSATPKFAGPRCAPVGGPAPRRLGARRQQRLSTHRTPDEQHFEADEERVADDALGRAMQQRRQGVED